MKEGGAIRLINSLEGWEEEIQKYGGINTSTWSANLAARHLTAWAKQNGLQCESSGFRSGFHAGSHVTLSGWDKSEERQKALDELDRELLSAGHISKERITSS